MSETAKDDANALSAKRSRDLLDRYRITTGDGFKLSAYETGDLFPGDLDKEEAAELLEAGKKRLSKLQELLYAGRTWSLLIVLQAMDAAGKDSTIKHVMTGVNPQGVTVTSFKAPSAEDLAHDFIWRISRALPARGMIGIFNRSHYEDVLVTRVHPERLAQTGLPKGTADGAHFWEHRLEAITSFERHLTHEGTRIVKLFLNVGRDEQKKRLLERLDDPEKTWKFDAGDLKERARWASYQDAYQTAIAATATKQAPWYIVPADRKWFTRLVVVEAIIAALSDLDLQPPKETQETRAMGDQARMTLEQD